MSQKRSIVLVGLGGPFRIVGILPAILYNTTYSQTLYAFGAIGSVKMTMTDPLPQGITFTDNGNGSCTFAGMSAEVGSEYPITVNAVDSKRNAAHATFVLRVMRFPMPKLIVMEDGITVICPEGKPTTYLRTE